jgi:molybdopterin molybdotransferase
MISPAEAEKEILAHLTPFHREDCALVSAERRVLRAEIRADRDLPPFDRVTMDGYALRSAAVNGGMRVFSVGGLQAAGMRAFQLGAAADACVEVMTGAVVPAGADVVVPYEQTEREGVKVTLTGELSPPRQRSSCR